MPAWSRGYTWLAGLTTPQILTKAPGEARTYTFSFINVLPSGVTISASPVPTIVINRTDWQGNDLTAGTPAVSGQTVTVLLSSGTDGIIYRVRCTCTASNGDTVVGHGFLQVTHNIGQ